MFYNGNFDEFIVYNIQLFNLRISIVNDLVFTEINHYYSLDKV